MKIRIHDTDYEGQPVACTGELFSGDSALAVVEAMKRNPFNAHLEPLDFMRRTLAAIGRETAPLPDLDPSAAAEAFLAALAAAGFAVREGDETSAESAESAERGKSAESAESAEIDETGKSAEISKIAERGESSQYPEKA